MIKHRILLGLAVAILWWPIQLSAQTVGVDSRPHLLLASASARSGNIFLSYSVFPAGDAPNFGASPVLASIEPVTPASAPAAVPINPGPDQDGGQQTKRIAGIVPNFQAVSADTYLPPLSFRQKFHLASQNTFDYSSFVFVGLQAEIEEMTNTYPEFGKGEAGFTRYYWRTFTDQSVGNYMSGAILPALTHEDPRYYTLYHGSFFHRSAYAFSRLWVTRNDAGKSTINISEMAGVAITTQISSYYYPAQERGIEVFASKWLSQLLNDGISNVFEEFWPDINRKFLHER